MYILEDPGRISRTFLDISLNSDYELYEPDEMMLSWEAVEMTEKSLFIQMQFKDPLLISAFAEPDNVSIQVASS